MPLKIRNYVSVIEGEEEKMFELFTLPGCNWKLIGTPRDIRLEEGFDTKPNLLMDGGRATDIRLDGTSFKVGNRINGSIC
jgi:hypothetical protein